MAEVIQSPDPTPQLHYLKHCQSISCDQTLPRDSAVPNDLLPAILGWCSNQQLELSITSMNYQHFIADSLRHDVPIKNSKTPLPPQPSQPRASHHHVLYKLNPAAIFGLPPSLISIHTIVIINPTAIVTAMTAVTSCFPVCNITCNAVSIPATPHLYLLHFPAQIELQSTPIRLPFKPIVYQGFPYVTRLTFFPCIQPLQTHQHTSIPSSQLLLSLFFL